MRLSTFLVVAAVSLLAGCAKSLLSSDDRERVCHVAVEDKFGAPVFHPNVLSNAAGGVTGAGIGAVAGLPYVLSIVAVPLGAVMGAGYGAACAAASLQHPAADMDFAQLLHDADSSAVKRALEADMNAPRRECSRARPDGSADTPPDTVIQIEKIDAGMGCLFGQQEYWVAVEWRAVSATTGKILASNATRCAHASIRTVDEWFANPDQARTEIERVLEQTGQRIATEMLTRGVVAECKLRSLKTGEVTAR